MIDWKRRTMDETFRPNASDLQPHLAARPLRVEPRWKAEAWIEKCVIAGIVGGGFVKVGLALLSD